MARRTVIEPYELKPFGDTLTCVATYAPAGFNDTIVRESTSFPWLIELIKTTFGLETRGRLFSSSMIYTFRLPYFENSS